MKTLVVIGSVWPEPNASAAGARILQLIRLLRPRFELVIFACAAEPGPCCADLHVYGVDSARIRLNCNSFDHWLAGLMPDAVLYDRFMTEEQFGWRVNQTCPSSLRLLDTEDLHSLRGAREQLHKEQLAQAREFGQAPECGPVLATTEQLYRRMAINDLAQRELAAIYRCDLSLMISEFEVRLLNEHFRLPLELVHYVPFVTQPGPDLGPAFEQRRDFVSIGNFRHPPNWDSVLWLKEHLWPALRARLPRTELHIYGAYMPPKARALDDPKMGFRMKGWAPEADAVMRRARVCLAPLRFGAGLKGKLLDAMRCATPSITTEIGAEAMAPSELWPGRVVNRTEEFIEAAAELYSQPKLWHRAQAKATPLLEERFAEGPHREAFLDRLEALRKHLDEHRSRNFVGSLLRHQQHRSTEYFSRWLALKNRVD